MPIAICLIGGQHGQLMAGLSFTGDNVPCGIQRLTCYSADHYTWVASRLCRCFVFGYVLDLYNTGQEWNIRNFPFFVRMHVKVKILLVNEWSCRSPQVMLTITSRMVNNFWARSPISFHHVSFWYLFLDSHPTIHHPNIGVCLTPETELGTSTLLQVWRHLILVRMCKVDDLFPITNPFSLYRLTYFRP